MRWLAAVLLTVSVLLGVSAPAHASTTVRADRAGLVTRAGYPEGPLWWHGRLYYVEYGSSRIMALHGRRAVQFWRQPGCGASAVIELPLHRLLVTCYDNNTLVVVNRAGRTVRTIRYDSSGRGFLGPNDFVRDRFGGIYFSASGVYKASAPAQGKVYYIAPHGGGIWPVAGHIDYSNGLAITPDGRRLLVASMLSHQILSYRILAPGLLGHRRVFARTDRIAPPAPTAGPLSGPDGMKIGPDGRLYIAQNGSGRVLVVDRHTMRLVRTIKVPAPYVTNMAFASHRRVYITSSFDPNHPPYPGGVYLARRR